jgi:hypothetical protein
MKSGAPVISRIALPDSEKAATAFKAFLVLNCYAVREPTGYP